MVPIIIVSTLKPDAMGGFAESINAQLIFEDKVARGRFFICSAHEPEEISRTIVALRRIVR